MKFFKLSLALIILQTTLQLTYASELKYYGTNSTEAILTFRTQTLLSGLQNASSDSIREHIDLQVQHLMGTFQATSFLEAFPYPGVLGETYKISKIKKKITSEGLLVSYSFSGKVAWDKRAFKANQVTIPVPLKLPLDPEAIYELGLVDDFNYCTDEHYNSEGDFWYFWDPDKEGCPLSSNFKDVLRFDGKLKRLPNTRSTYPEYQKLYGDNGNGKNLDIHLFIGYIDDENLSLTKPNLDDDAVLAMEEVETTLNELGFNISERKDAFREYSSKTGKGINFLRIYEKTLKTSTRKIVNVRVKILLSDTSIGSKDKTFHNHLVNGFEQADILVYDGHSGLGGNLNLDYLPTINFNKNKYQLYYFNGCSSYPYFNGMFFKAKGGSKNLDVITSGLPTYSDTAGANMTSFINAFILGRSWSYQNILRDMEESNGSNGTYLTGVNGDEDNVFKP